MDTVQVEIPTAEPVRRLGLHVVGAVVATTAVAAPGVGWVLGQTRAEPAPVRADHFAGSPQTWVDARRESIALKRHEATPKATIDVRKRRVEQ